MYNFEYNLSPWWNSPSLILFLSKCCVSHHWQSFWVGGKALACMLSQESTSFRPVGMLTHLYWLMLVQKRKPLLEVPLSSIKTTDLDNVNGQSFRGRKCIWPSRKWRKKWLPKGTIVDFASWALETLILPSDLELGGRGWIVTGWSWWDKIRVRGDGIVSISITVFTSLLCNQIDCPSVRSETNCELF